MFHYATSPTIGLEIHFGLKQETKRCFTLAKE